MNTRHLRRCALVAGGAAAIVAAAASSPLGATASGSLGYTKHSVGSTGGGEPSIIAAGVNPTLSSPGELYEASLSHPGADRSTTAGVTWVRGLHDAFNNTGDDCLATDQVGALYLCNLTITGPSTQPLQTDVYKSTDQGDNWVHENGSLPIPTGNNTSCAPIGSTSCNEFGVDRPWLDAWIPPSGGNNTNNAEVVLFYHDFYGPSHLWVNISTDGGNSFGAAQDVLTNFDPTVAVVQGVAALANTACSSVPSGVNIVKSGPHAGRIYVAFIVADASSAGTGCNLTQAQAFHNLYVAWLDPGHTQWIPQLAFDGGPGHDASSPFASFTIDQQGNPYFAFTMNHWDPNPLTNAELTQECGGFSTAGTQQAHPECEYDAYVVWSANGGTTWDDGTGTIPGSAGTPYLVNSDTGNHQYAAMAAGAPGHVDFAYLRTNLIEPTNASGKYYPAGCAGTGLTNPTPGTASPCPYDLYAAQTSNLTAPPTTAGLWTINDLSSPPPAAELSTPMHVGDICNLGIFCTAFINANRNLADFIMAAIDPTTGCAHIAYTDDNNTNTTPTILSQDQTGAACFTTLGAGLPETPIGVLMIPAGLAVAGAAGYLTRRRRRPISE